MKKKIDQQNLEKIAKLDNIRQTLINYVDIVIKGIIAFFGIGVLVSILLVGYLKWKIYIVIPIIFGLSVLITPLLSKIRVGEFIFQKYEKWLEKTFKL